MMVFDFDGAAFPQKNDTGLAVHGEPWTAFRMVPVLLHIAGFDLVASNSDADRCLVHEGLLLPLPQVAFWGLVALYHAARVGRSAYELDEHGSALLFESRGESLLVHSLARERTVQVNYDRLLTTWQDFDQRVRLFLGQKFGDLTQYPWWNAPMNDWLTGRLSPAEKESPYASMMFLDSNPHCFDRIDAVEA